MRRQRERVGFMRRALAVTGVLGLLAGVAGADVTTERSASILEFPKVISAGTRDTIIQITNTNNSMVHAHCIYVNAQLTIAGVPQSQDNPPLCNELDFDIWLTKQQPTMWLASSGRPLDPTDNLTNPCNSGNTDCYGVGIDPGFIPPVPADFVGELKCIETDITGAPTGGNHLKGEATLVNTVSGDVAKYNGLGILSRNVDNPAAADNVLCLGGCQFDPANPDANACQPQDPCPAGAEYNGSPDVWILNHFAEGAADPIAENAGATTNSVSTELTIVPTTEDLENKALVATIVHFDVTNEFETHFSASTTVTCWASFRLSEVNFGTAFNRSSLNTDFAQTRMRTSQAPTQSNPSVITPDTGVLMVAEEFHTALVPSGTTRTASAAVNLHVEYRPYDPNDPNPQQDTIRLQPDLVVNP